MASQARLFDRQNRPNGNPPLEAECLLGLARVRGLGVTSLRRIYEHFPHLVDIWSLSGTELASTFKKLHIKTPEVEEHLLENRERIWENGRKELAILTSRGIQLILEDDLTFPVTFRQLHDAPYWLFVEGDAKLLGLRNDSPVGVEGADGDHVHHVIDDLVAWLEDVVADGA